MNTFVKNIRNRNRDTMPPGKLADAELHFTGGELDGLKLRFGIWERRLPNRDVERNGFSIYHLAVSFPARPYTVGGERRRFALLRAIEDPDAQERLREFVLQAYLAALAETQEATPARS